MKKEKFHERIAAMMLISFILLTLSIIFEKELNNGGIIFVILFAISVIALIIYVVIGKNDEIDDKLSIYKEREKNKKIKKGGYTYDPKRNSKTD